MNASPLFIETIRYADGVFHNLDLHRARMERTCREVYGTDAPQLVLPAGCRNGVFKCRVTYSQQIEKIELEPYTPVPPRSIRLIECENIDYHLK